MEQRDWQGVFPAITTPFLESFDVDHARMATNTEVGQGNAVVRPPRLELVGAELTETLTLIRERLAVRPTLT